MNYEEFEKKYIRLGGIKKLTEMKDSFETQDKIANHFGVSKERVRQWMTEIFNIHYDPRTARKEKRIQAIKELIKIHGIEKTKTLYSGINKEYLKEAINEKDKNSDNRSRSGWSISRMLAKKFQK